MNPVMRDKCYVRRLARSPAGPIVAHTLLARIEMATPGGIRREQFVRRQPVKTALSILPFVALAIAAAFAIITR